jgi:DNA-binding NarL/FixJ family response regulator
VRTLRAPCLLVEGRLAGLTAQQRIHGQNSLQLPFNLRSGGGSGECEVLRAVTAVHGGEAIFGPGIAERMLALSSSAPRATADPFPQLTDRERQILELIAEGLNNAEIARRFVLSPKTVRNHISNIFAKMHVADRAQAIIRARDAGLGKRG